MKLRTKIALSFLFLVLLVITISFFLIQRNTQEEFEKFIVSKQKEIQEIEDDFFIENEKFLDDDQIRRGPDRRRFYRNMNEVRFAEDSPEARFLRATNNSLVQAGIIGIVISIFLAFLFSKFLLRKIYYLKDAMNEYRTKGEYFKVSHEKKDEIDELIETYNDLIEKLDRQENIRKEFFIDMSHELKTPITSIKGYLEGLIDGVFEPEKKIFQKTLNETNRMIHLIKELTSLAKMESGDITIKKSKVDLRKLTKEAAEDLEIKAEDKKIKINISGSSSAKIDKSKFKQVILNLIDNAITYSEKKSEIQINIKDKKDKSSWEIKNKNDKVSVNDLENIFERFFRSDKSRKYDEKDVHLGIGLSIAKKIVNAHGGQIKAQKKGDFIVFEVLI